MEVKQGGGRGEWDFGGGDETRGYDIKCDGFE